MYGNDFTYANTRIAETIVRIKKTGEPVYVHGCSNKGLCTISGITSMEAIMYEHLDELDLTPVKLGYINCAGSAAYIMRLPVRRGPNNQGLRQENSICSNGRLLMQMPMDALRNCIMGKYPTFDRACKDAVKNNKTKTIAFNRKWAVQGNGLWYKEKLVGMVKDGKPILDDKFKYLKEALEEIV